MARQQTQGKCVTCRVRYVWRGRPLLRAARCPQCKYLLAQTTKFLKWPVREETPLEDMAEADFFRGVKWTIDLPDLPKDGAK